jgi:hypothetical protein
VEQSDDPAYAAYRDNILHKQTAERYAAAWHHHNPPWYYLVEVIPFFWLPLSLLLPWLLPAWWRRLRRRDARLLLPLGFALLTLLFFSASPGKRGVYVLPLLPMVALAAAPLLPGLLRRPGVHRLGLIVLAAFALGLTALPFHPRYHALAAKEELDAAGLFFALGGVAFAWLGWPLWTRARSGLLALGGFLASLWLVYGFVAHPLLDGLRSGTRFTTELRAQVPAGFELGLVAWDEEVVLQAGRPITHFGFRRFGKDDEVDDALRWLVAAPSRLVLLPAPKDEACIIRARATDLGERSRRRWLLVGPESLAADCRARLGALGPPSKAVTWVPGPDRTIP